MTAVERLLRHERTIIVSGLAALWALTWAWLASGAGLGGASSMPDMAGMPGMPAMPMQQGPRPWSSAQLALAVGMWWTMMVAMMTPSATPAVLLYARVHRHAGAQERPGAATASTGAFVAGYFLAWLLFSIVATLLQLTLQESGLVSMAEIALQGRVLVGATLLLAGAWQLSPWKNACLSHCRAPAQFLSQHWRPGVLGALRLGAAHGGYCVGCCWLLMALLFVGGVMNLAWIAVLSLLVIAEKLLPRGRWLGLGAGVVLIAWGATLLLRWHLAP